MREEVFGDAGARRSRIESQIRLADRIDQTSGNNVAREGLTGHRVVDDDGVLQAADRGVEQL